VKVAVVEARRMSQHNASSNPPPRHQPFTAATTGTRAASSRSRTRPKPAKSSCCGPSLFKSSPEQKARPRPVTIRQRTASPDSAWSSAAMNASRMSAPSGLAGGLSISSKVTASLTCST
jgi:hypothetical protein